jgi:CFEM domain
MHHLRLPRATLFYRLCLISLVTTRTLAQDLSALPSCAVCPPPTFTLLPSLSKWKIKASNLFLGRKQTPAISSIGTTGCQLADIECICKDSAFINSLTPVVQKQCSPEDLQSKFSLLPFSLILSPPSLRPSIHLSSILSSWLHHHPHPDCERVLLAAAIAMVAVAAGR